MLRRHYDGVVEIDGRYYTSSDGTPEFVYREVVRKRGTWRIKFRGQKGTIAELRKP